MPARWPSRLYVLVSLGAGRFPIAQRARWRRLLELAAPVVALFLAGTATAGFLRFRGEVMAGVRRPVKYLLVFGTLTAAGMVAAWLCRGTTADAGLDPRHDEAMPPRLRVGVVDVAVAAVIALVVYVPGWRAMSGNAFAEYFLHLDFFAMGPALAFRSGAALGTDVHTYYGLGWPVLVSALGFVGRLSYGRVIQLETIYGCIYFVGVYALVRMLTRSRVWAVAGTALGILFSLFAGYSAAFVIWRFPAATVLRWAFDVWFFMAALLYLRTRQPRWLLAAGGLVGVAVFFQTDTGAYLAAAFAFLCACTFRMESGTRPGLGLVVRAWALGAGLLVLGIAVASRLTAFTSLDFWLGWLENLRLSVMGATLEPLTGTPGGRPIVIFVAMTAVYLAVAGYAVQQMVRHRLTPTTALLGVVAVYGFLTLGYFVGRSHLHNLYRPAVPFAIVVAGCGGVATSAARRRAAELGERWRARAVGAARAAPAVAAAVAVVMLVAHPGMADYPNAFGPEWAYPADARRCLQLEPRDICGLSVAQEAEADDIRAVAARIEAEPGPRPKVAVLDEFGPVVHLLADDRPWGLYQPMFSSMFTRHQLDVVRAPTGA